MSIKPVDFQIMIPKASEVSRLNADEHSRNQTLQQQQKYSGQHLAENAVKLVQSQDKAHGAEIKEKREKKEKEKEGKEEKEENKKKVIYSKDKKTESETQTSMIDIRV